MRIRQSWFNSRDIIAYIVSESDRMPTTITMARAAEKVCRRVATPSMFSYEMMKNQGLRVDDMVPHGYDIEYWSHKPREAEMIRARYWGRRILFANFANTFRKCPREMFHALALLLRRKVDNWILLLNSKPRGEYDYLKIISEYEKEYEVNLRKHIVFVFENKPPDFTPIDKLRAYYHASHIFLHPSCNEGFGMPIVEAMLAKKPVIHIDAPPMNEIVEREFGYPIKPCYTEYRGTWDRGAILYKPCIESYVDKLEEAILEDEEVLEEKGEKAYAKAVKYDFWKIYEYFVNPPERDDTPKIYDLEREEMRDMYARAKATQILRSTVHR